MTKFVARKRDDGALVPVDDDGRDVLATLAAGRDVMVEVKQARNVRHHRMYWALAGIVADNVEGFDGNKDAVSDLIKIGCHEVDVRIAPDTGEVSYVPRSLAYAAMEQTRFSRFFDRALHVVTDRWLTGNTTDDLRQRVLELVDGPQSASLGSRVGRSAAA